MPARVRCKGRTGYCVTHIWVDSPDSVASGRENWLLPKQLGRMVYRDEGRVREAALEKGDGNILAQMRFECPPFPPPLPAHSVLFPMPLLQQRQEQTVLVPFGGWGFGQPVSGGFVIKDPESLPVPPRAKRLPAVRLADFRLTFRRAVEL